MKCEVVRDIQSQYGEYIMRLSYAPSPTPNLNNVYVDQGAQFTEMRKFFQSFQVNGMKMEWNYMGLP